jgi:hypothetical protein
MTILTLFLVIPFLIPAGGRGRVLPSLPPGPGAGSPLPAAESQDGSPSRPALKLIDISLDALVAAGTSSLTDESLQILQAGGHDPRKRGFTIQNVELSFMGSVDPYFRGEAHVVSFIDPVSGDSRFELEEAFLQTQGLPWGLQLEAGQFFTEFGRLNPRHPHQWNWQDQAVIHSRLFGPDGMRGPGIRLGWLAPLPWFSEVHVGLQNANGETMASFLSSEELFAERAPGGRPFVGREVAGLADLVRLVRFENSWDLGDEVTTLVGLSGLFGPNPTGPDGRTRIFGADALLKWRPVASQRGWPFVLWETEVLSRAYRAAAFYGPGPDGAEQTDDDLSIPGASLKDWGVTSQLLWGFRVNWAAGIRFEAAGGKGDGLAVDLGAGTFEALERNADPYRDDRIRISPLLAWHPTEFSRVRLQYNFDRVKAFERRTVHSIWLGIEIMLGAHAAHKY